MCIYYGSREDLTYKKQEHIFPAGIGGIQKLNQGVVSDQANELFSPMELKLMHNSIISVARTLKGPGKRGSLSPRKATKSGVIIGKQENGDIVFSYLRKGIPFIVPCFMRINNKVYIHLDGQGNISKSPEIIRAQFLEDLKNYNGKYRLLVSHFIPAECLLIGYYEDHFYVGSKEPITTPEQVEKEILFFINAKQENGLACKKQEHLTQDIILEEGTDASRIYAKIAFNTLAFIKGESYVMQHRFDNMRNAILGKEEYMDILEQLPSARDDRIKTILPEDSHACIMTCFGGNLVADVRLYGYWGHMVILGTCKQEEFPHPDGFICDWKNRKEYRLIEYIELLSTGH